MSGLMSTEEGLCVPSRGHVDCASPEYNLRETAISAGTVRPTPSLTPSTCMDSSITRVMEGIVQDHRTAAEMFIIAASSGCRPAEIVRQELEDNEPDQ